MSSLGSTTAATPASSSPIRYDAQPRSSCVTCRNNTWPTLRRGRWRLLGVPALRRQRAAAARLEEVHLARVQPEAAPSARLDRARGLQPQDGLVLVRGRQVGPAGVGRQLGEVLALRALAAVGDVDEQVGAQRLDERDVGLEDEPGLVADQRRVLEVLGPRAEDDLAARRPRPLGQLELTKSELHAPALDGRWEEVHGRRADEARDEQVDRVLVQDL